jgi:hypothetical protein
MAKSKDFLSNWRRKIYDPDGEGSDVRYTIDLNRTAPSSPPFNHRGAGRGPTIRSTAVMERNHRKPGR